MCIVNKDGLQEKIKILHVLTLNTRDGRYGGPVRVARELCAELNRQNCETKIFSGTLKGFEPFSSNEIEEIYVAGKPISKSLQISSFWSWSIVIKLFSLVRESDLVHIHFARDLISFTAAIICILSRKNYVTQSHGMIIMDERLTIKLLDFLLTKPIWKRASAVLVLTPRESQDIALLCKNQKQLLLPNGIRINWDLFKSKQSFSNRIAFVSRLHFQKRIEMFLKLAERKKDTQFKFEIYGPDGGELKTVISFIDENKLDKKISYFGPLLPSEVQKKLLEVDILVLPSRYDPFPMIVLEALSVGTPVLIMPSCGLSEILKQLNENFVASGESENDLVQSFDKLSRTLVEISAIDIIEFCNSNFSITKVSKVLLDYYKEILENVR